MSAQPLSLPLPERRPTEATSIDGWMAQAVTATMLGGGPGGPLDQALQSLGLENPLLRGPLGQALASVGSAAIGPMAGGLPSLAGMLSGNGLAAMGNLMGAEGLNALLGATGLGNLPAGSALASMLGGEVGNALAGQGLGGMLTGALGDDISGLADAVKSFAPGGCLPQPDSGAAGALSVDGITADALDKVTDQLLAQWKVDDESSAAEHIAHDAVTKHKEELLGAAQGLATDAEGFLAGLQAKITSFVEGVPPGTGMPAVRLSDKDDKVDIAAQGVANILVEGLPISRMGDTLAPSTKKILQGAATVLSAGLPTARLSSATEVPSAMATGAASVLIGGASAGPPLPGDASASSTPTNSGPRGPEAPKSSSSEAGLESDSPDGEARNDGELPGAETAGPSTRSDSAAQPAESGTDTQTENGSEDALMSPSPAMESSERAASSSPQSLEELLNGPPSEPNQTYYNRVQVEDRGLYGVADHSYVAVYKDGERQTYSGRNRNFPLPGPLGVEKNYEADLNNRPDWAYVVPPPEGMTQDQWVDAVAGAGDNAVWNENTRDYSWHGGDGGETSGNCHVVSGGILADAAGGPVTIPHEQRPPRWSPGLPVEPPASVAPSTPAELRDHFNVPGEVTYSKPHINHQDPQGPGAIRH